MKNDNNVAFKVIKYYVTRQRLNLASYNYNVHISKEQQRCAFTNEYDQPTGGGVTVTQQVFTSSAGFVLLYGLYIYIYIGYKFVTMLFFFHLFIVFDDS